MTALEIIGAVAVGCVGLLVAIVALELVGNIYGGLRGAYRLREIMRRSGKAVIPHRAAILLGLKAWHGKRHHNGIGHHWRIGCILIPVDGRDRLEHETWLPR